MDAKLIETTNKVTEAINKKIQQLKQSGQNKWANNIKQKVQHTLKIESERKTNQ